MNYGHRGSLRFPFMIGIVLLGGAALSVGMAQEPTNRANTEPATPASGKETGDPELKMIRAGADAFVRAFNAGDAQAIADLWTEDCEYIDESGKSFNGREAIKQGYADFFAGNAGAKIRVVIDSLRLLGDQTAIEEGRTIVESTSSGSAEISKYTTIHVKVDGKWLMASVRDAWVEDSSAHSHLSDLDWLVGSWQAEEHGAKHESVFRWVADRNFLQRDYTTTRVDGNKTTGVQLIGWNPRQGHLQSWNFSGNGGHAIGAWIPRQSGWTVELMGFTAEGIPTTAVNQLTRLDDKAYAWQSIQRIVGDTSLPDTDEIVLKRQTPTRSGQVREDQDH